MSKRKKHFLTNSEWGCWNKCKQLHFFKYILGLTFRETVNIDLFIGLVWHDCLEVYWTTSENKLESSLIKLNELWRLEKEKSSNLFSTNPADYESPMIPAEEIERAFWLIDSMLREYDKKYLQLIESEFTMIEAEKTFSYPASTERGNKSKTIMVIGKVDIYAYHQPKFGVSEFVVLDHKTGTGKACDWKYKNNYKPQSNVYTWLVSMALDRIPKGTFFQISRKDSRPTWNDCKLLKSKKSLSKVLPKGINAEVFLQAILNNGFSLDFDWYRERLYELKNQKNEDHFFALEFFPTNREEILRIDKELYQVGTQIRDSRLRLWDTPGKLKTLYNDNKETWKKEVIKIIKENSHYFPRSGNNCFSFGKNCYWQNLCEYQNEDCLRNKKPKEFYHSELSQLTVSRETKPKEKPNAKSK